MVTTTFEKYTEKLRSVWGKYEDKHFLGGPTLHMFAGYMWYGLTKEELPALRADFGKPLGDSNKTAKIFLNLNGDHPYAVSGTYFPDWPINKFLDFDVFDLDLEKITDASVSLSEIRQKQLSTGKVEIYDDGEARKHGTRVVDGHVRDRVMQYFENMRNRSMERREEGKKHINVEKFRQLRNAATETTSVPGYGKYTYSDIRNEATAKYKREWNGKEMVEVPKEIRIFNEEDLKWLEEYMKNQGIPIPRQ